MSESLESLLAELNDLSGAKRRAILAELSPAERAAIVPLLADRAQAAPIPAAEPTPEAGLAALSPALREQVEAALGPTSNLTAAARAALADVIAKLAPQADRIRLSERTTPSLLGGLGRALGLRRQPS